MYKAYFELGAEPFSITPDPRLFYLSERHREALAHLLFGAGYAGGFVMLTGEVGTGKTLLCRAFLAQIDEQVEVALVLNPKLSAQELLRTICEELRLPLPDEAGSTKGYIDRINAYLLDAHAAGRRVVLIIDEAQNLAADVLEQVRLLTNLETEQHKLLQIFLVGQPELRELLHRPSLRQVDQRITARYHLSALGARDTRQYIQYRLACAGARRALFTVPALRAVFRHSQGVPRRINILCDRALLGAYATDRRQVNARVVHRAARELAGEGGRRRMPSIARIGAWAAVFLLGVLAVNPWGWDSMTAPTPDRLAPALFVLLQPEEDALEAPQNPSQNPSRLQMPPAPQPVADTRPGHVRLQVLVQAQAPDLREVQQRLLELWQGPVTAAAASMAALCEQVSAPGLRCIQGRGGWDDLLQLNRPAVLSLEAPDGERHALLVAAQGRTVTVQVGEERHTLPLTAEDADWQVSYLVLWRPPQPDAFIIGHGSTAGTVRWLEVRLNHLEGRSEPVTGRYTNALAERVQAFQRLHGLQVDGIVGHRTLIQIDNLVGEPTVPMLTRAVERD